VLDEENFQVEFLELNVQASGTLSNEAERAETSSGLGLGVDGFGFGGRVDGFGFGGLVDGFGFGGRVDGFGFGGRVERFGVGRFVGDPVVRGRVLGFFVGATVLDEPGQSRYADTYSESVSRDCMSYSQKHLFS